MNIIVVGTNHKYSPVELREKLFFTKGKLRKELFRLKEKTGLKGAVILSTCNRTEIYAGTEDVSAGVNEIAGFLSENRKIDEGVLRRHLYIYEEKGAAKHLSRVCSGFDSLIIGETQILRQVKDSFGEAENTGLIGAALKDIFQFAMATAKTVRAKTRISEGKVSVGSVAVDFIKQKIGTISGKNILIIGTGKVTELVLKYLKDEKASVFFVSNRTYDKAKVLAGRIGGEAVRFDDLKRSLEKADVVITATASPHFVIKKEMIKEIEGPLFIVDLALPRDVEPGVRELKTVELYCLEDMNAVIRENMERKAEEAEKAGKIIDIEVEKQWREPTESELEPALLP